jgi:hypothetical protein
MITLASILKGGIVGNGQLTLVVRIKDDVFIVLVGRRERLPEGLHAGDVGDDLVVVAAVVVRDDHGVCFFVGDVLDRLFVVSGEE